VSNATTWTEAQRRNKRREYARHYKSPGARIASHVMRVPDDVERREESAPCFACGTARGPCRHRGWIAA
jgi:hypothetical protein